MTVFRSSFHALFILAFLATSCGDKPKVIQAEGTASTGQQTGVFASNDLPAPLVGESPGTVDRNAVHTVVVEEVLPTTKYVYLFVQEGEEQFWIATAKQEVEVGETYFFKGGLLKTNFISKEHNRVFDTMYLVSRIVPVNHGQSADQQAGHNHSGEGADGATTNEPRDIEREGSVRIAELVGDPAKFDGQTIQISGECVKVNPNIMGRNWMHFKDGSQDEYDLVVTSDLAVPEGHVVTMQATVALNKDFGAGYRYDIILENGVLLQ